MNAAMVATWTHPFPGREEKALSYAKDVNEYWTDLATKGRCSPPEIFFSDTGLAFWIVRGEREQLLLLSETDQARLLMVKGELLLDSFRVEFYHAGEAALDYLEQYGKVLATIG
ncbi:MAG TPA: hypothetical protein VFN80_06160 [Acidothermaceae bacterium]|nr:hypothetical protein [Acidothermaceae bacterium]